jgi:adenylate cyclase
MTVLEASVRHGLQHVHACGGEGRCTTCRVEVLEGLDHCSPMSPEEREVLSLAGFGDRIRLGCLMRPTGDIKVRLVVREDAESPALRPEGMAREREVAVLFSDVRGFTTFAEQHLAFDVLHLLNRYFDRLGTIVDLHSGQVIAFLGDGMVCLFEHVNERVSARSATQCALQMLKSAELFAQYAQEHFKFELQVGIGIAWGHAVIGQVGYYNYTHLNVVGDVVNTASRVQDATKETGARLLVTEGIRRLTENRFRFGKEHTLELRGKEGQHQLHEVLGEKTRVRKRAGQSKNQP